MAGGDEQIGRVVTPAQTTDSRVSAGIIALAAITLLTVSYTHLTLPTILRV